MMGARVNVSTGAWLAKVKRVIDRAAEAISGDARKEAEEALAAAKAVEQAVTDHAAALVPALKVVLQAVEPELQAAAVVLVQDFIKETEAAFGITAAVPPPAPSVTPPAPRSVTEPLVARPFSPGSPANVRPRE